MLSRTFSFRVCVAIGMSLLTVSCASLYQPLPKRIKATHLSCETYPLLVDGNLATTGRLKVKDFAEKSNTNYRYSNQYGDWVEGKYKAEAVIQFDTLTPVAYIKVHPISTIYRLSVETSTTEITDKRASIFAPVRSHKIARSEHGEVIRINIDSSVRVLKVVIYVNRDSAHVTQEPLTHKTKVTFEDVMIREIQVYQ